MGNRYELLDVPGLRPAAHGAPVAIVSYYLYTKNTGNFCKVIPRYHMRHAPPMGAGLARRGAIISHDIGFTMKKTMSGRSPS